MCPLCVPIRCILGLIVPTWASRSAWSSWCSCWGRTSLQQTICFAGLAVALAIRVLRDCLVVRVGLLVIWEIAMCPLCVPIRCILGLIVPTWASRSTWSSRRSCWRCSCLQQSICLAGLAITLAIGVLRHSLVVRVSLLVIGEIAMCPLCVPILCVLGLIVPTWATGSSGSSWRSRWCVSYLQQTVRLAGLAIALAVGVLRHSLVVRISLLVIWEITMGPLCVPILCVLGFVVAAGTTRTARACWCRCRGTSEFQA